MSRVTALSAVTLATADMARSTTFYEALGFERIYGGPQAGFTSYRAGESYLNLIAAKPSEGFWGRAIFYVDDVDAFHAAAVAAGLEPQFESARCELGRALLPHHRPRRPRNLVREAAALAEL